MAKQERDIPRKDFFDWKINIFISKISNIMLVLLFVVYSSLFILGISLIKKDDISKTIIPNYEHTLYNDEIDDYITFFVLKTYETEGNGKVNESISYRFVYGHEGRADGATSDPEYRIASFSAQATRTEGFDSKKINDVYYFTEQTSTTTDSTNNYSLVTDNGKYHPNAIYTRTQYYIASETKEATNKEELMLMPSSYDKKQLEAVFETVTKGNEDYDKCDAENTEEKSMLLHKVSTLNLRGYDDTKVGIFHITANRMSGNDGYSYRIYINIDDRTKAYHIDAQVWAETSDGTFYPLCGVYNLSKKYGYYNSSYYNIYDESNTKYVCVKVVYYDAEGNQTISYYKQDIARLKASFSVSSDGVDYTIKK